MMGHSLITIFVIRAMSRDCSPTEGIGVRVGLYLFVLSYYTLRKYYLSISSHISTILTTC